MVPALAHALRSKENPSPFLYDDILDGLAETLNQLASDEGSFANFVRTQYVNNLRDFIRRLPGPAPRQVNEKYTGALDSAISVREKELAELRSRISDLTKDLGDKQTALTRLTSAVDRQTTKITEDAATITQVAASANDQLRDEWSNRLAAWETERQAADNKIDVEMSDRISLLAAAASVGQRLVEHAAGQLTATEWAKRATRERKNAIWLRIGSLTAFVGALFVGGYILWHAIDRGFTLTVGDGILRGALVIALVGVGSFLTAEGRRHFKEADSAEEVALTLIAIEPFYAGAGDTSRASARDAVGDTVFVKNVLSRFSSRDAAKHGGVSNAQLSEVVDLLTKSSDLARKASSVSGPN